MIDTLKSSCLLYLILLLLANCQTIKKLPNVPVVTAIYETDPVQSTQGEDAADDPAIWVHPTQPEKSLIIGSNKKAGLEVYDLRGKRLQFYPVGLVNNVDVRYGFPLKNGRKIDIVACTERGKNELLVFQIHPPNELQLISQNILSQQKELYGFCLYHNTNTNQFYAFANDKNGTIEQWQLEEGADQKIVGKLVKTLRVNSQPEGMVADDRQQLLYVGEEEKGIWMFDLQMDTVPQGVFLTQSGKRNRNIRFDIEGLTIYRQDSTQYLIASIQGNNTFALFDISNNHQYIGSFSVKLGEKDTVKDTDGIDVTAVNLGPPYESGILVVQDGFNFDANGRATTQNFKLIPWALVSKAILE